VNQLKLEVINVEDKSKILNDSTFMKAQPKQSSTNKKDLAERVANIENRIYMLQSMIENQDKTILNHIQNDSLIRMEGLVVNYLLSKGKNSFAVKEYLYYAENHYVAYVKTKDNEFYRIEVLIDDYMNFNEKRFDTEKEMYCALYDELMINAEKLPEGLRQNVLKEAEKVGKLCG